MVLADNVDGGDDLDLIVTTMNGNVFCFSTPAPHHPLKVSENLVYLLLVNCSCSLILIPALRLGDLLIKGETMLLTVMIVRGSMQLRLQELSVMKRARAFGLK